MLNACNLGAGATFWMISFHLRRGFISETDKNGNSFSCQSLQTAWILNPSMDLINNKLDFHLTLALAQKKSWNAFFSDVPQKYYEFKPNQTLILAIKVYKNSFS